MTFNEARENEQVSRKTAIAEVKRHGFDEQWLVEELGDHQWYGTWDVLAALGY